MSYKDKQRKIQTAKLHYKFPELFKSDKGFGNYGEYTELMFILKDGKNNLFEGIVSDSCAYFNDNDIAWWGDNEKYPTGHLISSQIQCLNFLFALRKDPDAVLKLAHLFDADIEEVLPTLNDSDKGYIAFEFIYENAELLGETDAGGGRGTMCTSIDAFIIAQRKGKKVLIPIEWKYTEQYADGTNKALEYRKGITRQYRYNHLIEKSVQLRDLEDKNRSVYYYEPLYEFMRQTLLVEQMVEKGIADDFLHVVVVPPGNQDLLSANYSFSDKGLEGMWREVITDNTKFKLVDSRQIYECIEKLPLYVELSQYLRTRYYL